MMRDSTCGGLLEVLQLGDVLRKPSRIQKDTRAISSSQALFASAEGLFTLLARLKVRQRQASITWAIEITETIPVSPQT